MKYIDALGISLKDDFLLDLFETYEVDVSYIYDRTHEGMDDEYRAEIPEMGLVFLFNKTQCLSTIFMKIEEHSGFNPFFGTDPRNAPFKTGSDALEFAKNQTVSADHQKARKNSRWGEIPEWVKLNYGSYSMHYEFSRAGVEMVTLQLEGS